MGAEKKKKIHVHSGFKSEYKHIYKYLGRWTEIDTDRGNVLHL